ncbi:MAG: chemotaxis protein CheW [Geobacteraceae bacterium GWC2_58_44]|nr:MAG: chemotaxis protein CheW [Geobacteraceae bacterium GWC2_58_44]
MVTFYLDREEYGVDVMAVREIINMTEITKMANAPSHVEGIINLRGQIVPIVSLRKRFGLPEADGGFLNCIAVMDFGGELSGFIIDEVSDVIRVSRSEILPPLDVAGQPWIEGILSLDQRLVILMNLEHLA